MGRRSAGGDGGGGGAVGCLKAPSGEVSLQGYGSVSVSRPLAQRSAGLSGCTVFGSCRHALHSVC